MPRVDALMARHLIKPGQNLDQGADSFSYDILVMCIACGTSATSPIGYVGFTCGRVQSAVTLTSTVGRP